MSTQDADAKGDLVVKEAAADLRIVRFFLYQAVRNIKVVSFYVLELSKVKVYFATVQGSPLVG